MNVLEITTPNLATLVEAYVRPSRLADWAQIFTQYHYWHRGLVIEILSRNSAVLQVSKPIFDKPRFLPSHWADRVQIFRQSRYCRRGISIVILIRNWAEFRRSKPTMPNWPFPIFRQTTISLKPLGRLGSNFHTLSLLPTRSRYRNFKPNFDGRSSLSSFLTHK